MSLSKCFIEYLRSFSNECLSQEVQEQAYKTLLDYLGVSVAGFSLLEHELDYQTLPKSVENNVCIIGSDLEMDPLNAAFLNGFHAHVCELDDGHRFGMLHLAAPIYSALISVAATNGLSWDSFYKGAVTGYEAAIKLARLMQPEHKLRGFHATGTCGSIGASIAVCIALDYSFEQMNSALAMAATSAAGLLALIDDSSQLKPYNVGRAAMDGLQSAIFGKMNLYPPDDVLGGKRGLLYALSGVILDETTFCHFLEEEQPEILNIYFKPYAACRHSHPAIEAAISLAEKIKDVKQIDKVLVETYKLAVAGHEHQEIRGVSSAKMSTCYGVASALLYHCCNIQQYNESYLKKTIQSGLIEKITIFEDVNMTSNSPAVRAARVTITLEDGSQFIEEVDYPKGEPENPMSLEDIVNKMEALFQLASRLDARAIAECVLHSEKTPYEVIINTMDTRIIKKEGEDSK